MADDVVIGSASVQIVGDYSGLEKSFTESQNLAQSAGQKISAAFDSSAAGANALTTAVGTVATSVEDLASKSGLAGGELAIFKAALQGSLDAGVPLNAALQDIAASGGSLGISVAAAAQALQQETQAAAAAAGGNDALDDSFKRVRSDAEALEAAWQRAIEEDKKLADAAKRDAAAFQQAWSDAIKENNTRAQAEFQKFADGVENFISHPLQAAGAAVKDFMLVLGPMGLVATAGAAALAAIGVELFQLVQQFGQAAEATGNMADRLNLTWRETRNLEEMAQIAGVSISGLQQASFRLAESLDATSANGKKVAEALQSIGVTGNTTGQLLTGFLAKLAQIPDDTQRIALAHEVLGRSSQQILPLIKNYGELQRAIRELGPAIGDQLAGDLQKSDDALDKHNIAWNRFKENIAAQVAPSVKELVDQFRMLIVETSKLTLETIGSAKALVGMIPSGLIESVKEFAGALALVHSWTNPFTLGIRTMIAALQEFNLIVGAISGKAATDMATGIQTMDKALRTNLTASLHAATTGTKEFLDAFKNAGGGVASVIDNIIASQAKLSGNVRDAREAYNQLNQAFKDGTTVANGHKVTVDDVARALANLKAAEAAAATTKADHTEKTKALTKAMPPLADRTAEWVAQIKAATTEHQKLIGEASKLGELIGRYVTVAEMAAIKTAALATSLRVANAGFEDGDVAIVSYMGNAEKIAPLMDQVAASITATAQAALDTDPYAKLEAALDALGIKGQQYYKDLADKADAAYQVVLDSGLATYEELAQAALTAAAAEIRAALEVGDITREEADKTLAQIESDLSQLDAASAGSAQTRGRHERTLGEDIQAINKKTFDSIERGLADTIVNLKGFDDLWRTLWQGLAKDLLNIMFKVLLDPLEKRISKVLGGVFGGGTTGAGNGGAVGTITNQAQQAASGGSSGAGAGGGGASGLMGLLTTVFTGVSAVTSVLQFIQGMHQETTLNAIEESTRYLKIGLVTQGDSLLNDSHIIRNTLTDFMKWNLDVFQTYLQNINIDLDKLTNMGGVHSTAATSQISTFSTNKAVVADQSTNVNVTIDTVASDVTDAKVRDVFNRGIRMSKLAGAFPAGRFPQ